MDSPSGEGAVYSEAELKMLLERSTVEGELEEGEQEMLYKVFDFADKEAHDVMRPRPEVLSLSVELPPEECLRQCSTRRTRATPCTATSRSTSSACCT